MMPSDHLTVWRPTYVCIGFRAARHTAVSNTKRATDARICKVTALTPLFLCACRVASCRLVGAYAVGKHGGLEAEGGGCDAEAHRQNERGIKRAEGMAAKDPHLADPREARATSYTRPIHAATYTKARE